MANSTGEVSRRNEGNSSHPRQESDSSSPSMANRDRESENGGKTILLRRINGTVLSAVSERSTDLEFEERNESQRQNVIALVVIFVSSLVVMALLFYNFPELDE